MNRSRLLKGGVTGAVIAGVCCFTPALALLLGALGLSTALAWADYVLLPLLGFSLAAVAYALIFLRRTGP